MFERLGAAPDLARVSGLRAPCAASSDGILTPRERQVLALIATGLTDERVAQNRPSRLVIRAVLVQECESIRDQHRA